MWRNSLLSIIIYVLLIGVDESYIAKASNTSTSTSTSATHRNRMFKFALFQDLLVVLNILKMLIIEGYTISGVVQRIRSSGPMTHIYLATSVVLHGSLFFHEATNHQVRLNPVPYDPPTLGEGQKDLFLL